MRLPSRFKGTENHITIPAHDPLRVGTLSQILSDLSTYLELEKEALLKALFASVVTLFAAVLKLRIPNRTSFGVKHENHPRRRHPRRRSRLSRTLRVRA